MDDERSNDDDDDDDDDDDNDDDTNCFAPLSGSGSGSGSGSVVGVWCVVCGVWCVVCGVWCMSAWAWDGRQERRRRGKAAVCKDPGAPARHDWWHLEVAVQVVTLLALQIEVVGYVAAAV